MSGYRAVICHKESQRCLDFSASGLPLNKIYCRYVQGLLKGRTISHFYSSEPYGDHMSKALGAINRTVDVNRRTIPVSGTAIRTNPADYTAFLHPEVYKDLIINIVFLGAPSTGKTTMAEICAKQFSTVWMPEYGREYWEEFNIDRRLTAEQLVEIAKGHLQREDKKIMEAKRYLFTDTNAITTFMFSLYYHGFALPSLVELARAAETRYQIFFLCDTDIPYDDTWDRSGDVKRREFQNQIRTDLETRGIQFSILMGDIQTRMTTVQDVLTQYRRDWSENSI